MASVRLVVDHHFYAKDGSSVVCTTVGEAMDSGDKASNKAMSAALKYALTETYMIPTYEADRDTEDASPERGPSRPAGNHTPPQASPPGSQSDRQRLSHAVECVRTVAELTALVPAMSALNLSKSDPLRLRWGARRDELSKEVAT